MEYYFSYGSNNWDQIKERANNSHIRPPLPAKLEGYKRVYQGYSKNWHNSGRANILHSKDDVVFGSLYLLDPTSLHKLALYEHGYNLMSLKVFDIQNNKYVRACTFAINSEEPHVVPSKEYCNAIRKNLSDAGLKKEANLL